MLKYQSVMCHPPPSVKLVNCSSIACGSQPSAIQCHYPFTVRYLVRIRSICSVNRHGGHVSCNLCAAVRAHHLRNSHTNTRSRHRAPAPMIVVSVIQPRFPPVIVLPSTWETGHCRLCCVLAHKKRHFTQCRMSSSARPYRSVDNGGLDHLLRRSRKHI